MHIVSIKYIYVYKMQDMFTHGIGRMWSTMFREYTEITWQRCAVNLNNREYNIFIVGNVNKLVFVLLGDFSKLLSNYLLNSFSMAAKPYILCFTRGSRWINKYKAYGSRFNVSSIFSRKSWCVVHFKNRINDFWVKLQNLSSYLYLE